MTAAAERFYVTGGTLQYNAPSYVVRQADTDLLEGLRQGEFCYILNARQMGKSSLMTRAAVKLRQEGFTVAVLDLTEYGSNLTIEQWYYGMLRSLGDQIHLFDEVVDFWRANKEIGPLHRFFAALRQVVLPALPDSRKDTKGEKEETSHNSLTSSPSHLITSSSLVLFIDEIDYVRSMPFSTDEFFAAIRECYNHRAQDPVYNRLAFCLIGVATPADLIRDTRTTPFNIGRRIELRDFTAQEAAPLAAGLVHYPSAVGDTEAQREHESRITPDNGNGSATAVVYVSEGNRVGGFAAKDLNASPPNGHDSVENRNSKIENRKLLDRILYWTGGHPYLTQRLCRAVSQLNQTPEPAAIENRKSKIENPTVEDVDRLCHTLYLSRKARETDDNLAFVRNRLLRNEADIAALLDLYARIRNRRNGLRIEAPNTLVDILLLAGIVRNEDGVLRVRNNIYATVFDRDWILSNMPDAELQRQRRAYRRGLIRAATVSGVLLAIMASLTAWAITSAQTAQEERQNALAEKIKAQDQRNKAQDAAIKAQQAEQQAKLATEEKDKEKQTAIQEKNKAILARQAETKAKNRVNTALQEKTQAFQAKTQALQAEKVALSNVKQARASEQITLARDERLLYPFNISRAQRAINQGDLTQAQKLLEDVHKTQHQKLSCGFEWHYLRELCKPGPVQDLKAHDNFIGALAYSTDGTLLVSGDYNNKVRVWDVDKDGTVRLKPVEPLAYDKIQALVLTNDKKTLILGGTSGVSFVSAAGGQPYANPITQELQPDGQRRNVNALALSPDGSILAIGRRSRYDPKPEGVVELWDLAHYKKLAFLEHRDLKGTQPNVHAIAFSPDGHLIASGGSDGYDQNGKAVLLIKVWDVTTHKEVATLTDPYNSGRGRAWVNSLAFSPDSHFLASGNADHSVHLWNMQRVLTQNPDVVIESHRVFSKSDETLQDNPGSIWSLAFSHDGKLLAAGDTAHTILLWDVSRTLTPEASKRRPPLVLTSLLGHNKEIRTLAFSPDNTHLASAGGDGVIKIWDLMHMAAPPLYAHQNRQRGAQLSLAYSLNGHYLASSSQLGLSSNGPCEVRVWDMQTQQEIPCGIPIYPVNARLAFAPDNRTLAIGTESENASQRHLILWDVVSRKEVGEFAEMKDPITALAFSSNGLLATAHGYAHAGNESQYHIRLWDTQHLKEITEKDNPALKGFGKYYWDMYSLAFSPDGKFLVAGGGNGDMWWWDMTTYRRIPFSNLTKYADKLLQAMPYLPPADREHDEAIKSIAFSPDGKWMATGGDDKFIKLWDVKTRQVRFTLRGHSNKIAALAFSPESKSPTRTLASSSYDKTVRLWPLSSAEDELVQDAVILQDSLEDVRALTFSPDGTTLATGHDAGVIQLRKTTEDELPNRKMPNRTTRRPGARASVSAVLR